MKYMAIISDMRNRTEDADKEATAPAAWDICVPGLSVAFAELRAAYPHLSDESLARILGLPTKKEHAPGAAPLGIEQVTK